MKAGCKARKEGLPGSESSSSVGKRILLAGLGNELLKDDGVGVHAIRLLSKECFCKHVPNVKLAEVGVHVLDALHLFEWASDIIAVDAMSAGRKPGTMYMASHSDIQEWDATGGLHEFGLIGALRMIRHRPRVTILGIEPEIVDYGMDLSETLQSVLPQFMVQIRERVNMLLSSAVTCR